MENSDVGQALRTRSLCRHNSPVLVVSSDDQGLKMKRDWKTTRPGFEPGQREPKSLVLPLHYRVLMVSF